MKSPIEEASWKSWDKIAAEMRVMDRPGQESKVPNPYAYTMGYIQGAKDWGMKWISVKDRKPDKMQRVWVYSSDGIHSYSAAIYNGSKFLFDGTMLSGQLFDKVSDKPIFVMFWSPLSPPEPPPGQP